MTGPITTLHCAAAQARGAARALLIIVGWGMVVPGPAPAQTSQDPDTAAAALHALFDEEWERAMRENPTWASTLGDRRYNDRWPDRSLDAIERRHREDRAVLDRLTGIDPSILAPDERLNYELFHQRYQERVEAYPFRDFLMPISHRGGIQTADQLVERLRFTTRKDYEDWVARLQTFGDYMDQTIALLSQGIVEGWVPPRLIMERVPEQIDTQIVVKPSESPFFAPMATPAPLKHQEWNYLRREATWAIQGTVVPAFQRLQTFFTTRYLPACRETVGAWDLPDGPAYYEHRTRVSTGIDLTPEEIHLLGLQEVGRIRRAMEDIIVEIGFAGTFAEFIHYLRTDPSFYYEDPQELLEAYALTCKKIEPELVRLFNRLPRAPYGLRPIPDAIAPHTTTAYYSRPAADGSRAGYFYVNLYRPEVRPTYEIEVLSAHEAVPGHHLQIALAMELGELPRFRRYGGYTAYTEGWGLYAESLGEELGLYEDPYSKFGQLTYEMWRAVRLVVDTGIHHLKWDRQRAIDYFMANAAKTEHDIINEIDRYIGWPGQALAYKIGELKIMELRERARERLQDRFELATFHDVVLGSGAVPLDVLERQVDAWIEEQLPPVPPGETP